MAAGWWGWLLAAGCWRGSAGNLLANVTRHAATRPRKRDISQQILCGARRPVRGARCEARRMSRRSQARRISRALAVMLGRRRTSQALAPGLTNPGCLWTNNEPSTDHGWKPGEVGEKRHDWPPCQPFQQISATSCTAIVASSTQRRPVNPGSADNASRDSSHLGSCCDPCPRCMQTSSRGRGCHRGRCSPCAWLRSRAMRQQDCISRAGPPRACGDCHREARRPSGWTPSRRHSAVLADGPQAWRGCAGRR